MPQIITLFACESPKYWLPKMTPGGALRDVLSGRSSLSRVGSPVAILMLGVLNMTHLRTLSISYTDIKCNAIDISDRITLSALWPHSLAGGTAIDFGARGVVRRMWPVLRGQHGRALDNRPKEACAQKATPGGGALARKHS